MEIIKFGGTSVSSKKSLNRIKSILSGKKESYIIVVSALSQVTNTIEQLLNSSLEGNYIPLLEQLKKQHHNLIQELFPPVSQTNLLLLTQQSCNELESLCESIEILQECSPKTIAKALSYGEWLSSAIVKQYLESNDINLHFLNSQSILKADGEYLNAVVNFKETQLKVNELNPKHSYITQGFVAQNDKGEIVTLGRGGSDYTAAILAKCINASKLEIWSDVSGVHTANPTKVANAQPIHELSYKEAMEMAYFGAKVLYPPTLLPIMEKQIPLFLKNTNQPEDEGTFIGSQECQSQQFIKGISSLNSISMLSISGVGLAQRKGFARRVFQAFEKAEINVILITQSCSEQSIGIAISTQNVEKAVEAIHEEFVHEMLLKLVNPVNIIKNLSVVAVIGDNMRKRSGLSGDIFSVLGHNGINITAIAQGASERNISIVVSEQDELKALNAIHQHFFSTVTKEINLFVAGVGNVGQQFLEILEKQSPGLESKHQVKLKLVGMANSKKMLLNEQGITDFENLHKVQKSTTINEFVESVIALNLPNSIFIDNTASQEVSNTYADLLSNSISVVTCNKIACSSSYSHYENLHQIAAVNQCWFKYETTVGAALPVIKTIDDLIQSGDNIKKIEAVLSGSLNYIFNSYDGSKPFSAIVKNALEEGYTEPNPLIDLSGLDVCRKILILARESQRKTEIEKIHFKPFLPEACTKSQSNDELFKQLDLHESHFQDLFERAKNNKAKLKVVAQLNGEAMEVSLSEIGSDSPFYHLEGKDNVVAIHSDRYEDFPLVIKGAGAGAKVTASGVFADLMYIVKK